MCARAGCFCAPCVCVARRSFERGECGAESGASSGTGIITVTSTRGCEEGSVWVGRETMKVSQESETNGRDQVCMLGLSAHPTEGRARGRGPVASVCRVSLAVIQFPIHHIDTVYTCIVTRPPPQAPRSPTPGAKRWMTRQKTRGEPRDARGLGHPSSRVVVLAPVVDAAKKVGWHQIIIFTGWWFLFRRRLESYYWPAFSTHAIHSSDVP